MWLIFKDLMFFEILNIHFGKQLSVMIKTFQQQRSILFLKEVDLDEITLVFPRQLNAIFGVDNDKEF